MAKILIGILALLFLAGGAGGYVLFLAAEEDEVHLAEAVQRPAPSFVPMEPVTLPAIRADGVRGLVGFRIVLELADGRSPLDVKQWLPRFEDAFVTELASLLAVDWPGGGAIDFEIARARLLRESDRVVGTGVVANVLFEQVQVRVL